MGMVLMAQGKGIIGLQGLSELEQAGATIPTDDGTKTKKEYVIRRVDNIQGTIDSLMEGYQASTDGTLSTNDPDATKLQISQKDMNKPINLCWDSLRYTTYQLRLRQGPIYILKPRKWQVDVDILGDPTDGSDIPSKWTFHEEGEEELQLSAAIELEAGGNSAGSYGPLNFSAEIKAKTGISWMKTVKTQYAHDTTIDETKLYVPIPTRAKLLSDVISAYNTSFALFWGA
ncbi:hypothetical protein ETB97_011030 [Aspergillus alliaceus]|uniref:Uncharacterized protein n=1 Tax=Petromyces alliaceus TaxID=209559 RepID=A0A8H6E804_PETAA|nr:hypothetical protein ETB97_011030 [Aspergillus burnettii]